VKLQIRAALDDPWDQKPIRFQDALGRRYPIPLEVCKTFQVSSLLHRFLRKEINNRKGLLAFLKFAFKDTPTPWAVEERQFWLFEPATSQAKRWNLIDEEDWDTFARPGKPLGMSLLEEEIPHDCIIDDKLRCQTVTDTDSVVRFETPLPAWATYPQDVEFRYR
jgi:hypothetical protein